jgi:hypothetical protein
MQSLFGGLFYLLTTVVAWNEFGTMRQESKLKSQVAILDAWMKENRRVDSPLDIHRPRHGAL